MPAPMTAPIASITRSPAPRTRFSECASSPGGWRSSIGFRTKMEMGSGVPISESVSGFVRGDDDFALRAERNADERAARYHQLRRRVEVGKPVHAARPGEGVDDVQRSVGRKREPLRTAQRRLQL